MPAVSGKKSHHPGSGEGPCLSGGVKATVMPCGQKRLSVTPRSSAMASLIVIPLLTLVYKWTRAVVTT